MSRNCQLKQSPELWETEQTDLNRKATFGWVDRGSPGKGKNLRCRNPVRSQGSLPCGVGVRGDVTQPVHQDWNGLDSQGSPVTSPISLPLHHCLTRDNFPLPPLGFLQISVLTSSRETSELVY